MRPYGTPFSAGLAGLQEAIACCLFSSFSLSLGVEATVGGPSGGRPLCYSCDRSLSLGSGGQGSLWLRLTAEHRQAEVARVLFTHLLLEGLLLTFQQGQEAGSQTMERGTEEQTQRDRQGKTHSQG